MSLYCIGDLQGCDSALGRLLDTIGFSPSRDTIYLLGDLVNRGPESAQVLRRVAALGSSAHCVLGNHDLHLLAASEQADRIKAGDTLASILDAPDREGMLDWLRQQRMALFVHGHLMIHAGVLPQWTAEQTMALAGEVETILRGGDLHAFLLEMYGNKPNRWSDALTGNDRLRVIVNSLTRLRFCTADGEMEFKAKEGAGSAPQGYMPWYDVPGRRTANVTVCFGHWSTLGLVKRPDLLSLDTGCVWGGCLTAARIDTKAAPGTSGASAEIIQVHCDQAQAPGQF